MRPTMCTALATASFFLQFSSPAGAAPCDTSVTTPVHSFESEDALREKLAGVWQLCGHETDEAALSPTSHEGLEVTADGAMYLARRDGSGAFVRQWGFANEYQSSIQYWDYPLVPSDFYWRVMGDTGVNVVAPNFTQDAQSVRFSREGASSVYRKVDEDVLIPPVADHDARKGRAGCAQQEAVVRRVAHSADDMRGMIGGTWWDCKIAQPQPGIFDLLPAWALGIRFDADGTWHYLVTESGTQSSDPEGTGQWSIQKHDNAYQIILNRVDGSRLSLIWSFSEAPVKAHLLGLLVAPGGQEWQIVNGMLSGMP